MQTDDRQARRGRVQTVQTNPRECPSRISGVVGHRGNVDYQDCRRTLVYGYANSYRRASNAVRLNGQRIDPSGDQHLFARAIDTTHPLTLCLLLTDAQIDRFHYIEGPRHSFR